VRDRHRLRSSKTEKSDPFVDKVPELKLDRKKFRKVIDTHTVGITYYINDQDGITYEIQQGRVDGVEYYPPKKYQHLYCGDSADEKAQSPSIKSPPQ
jgi:hypothetical protein